MNDEEAGYQRQCEAGAALPEPHAVADEECLVGGLADFQVEDADIRDVLIRRLVRDPGAINEA